MTADAQLAALADGIHTLAFTSVPASGAAVPTSASIPTFRWAVRTTPPVVTLVSPPGLGLARFSRAHAWDVHLASDVAVRSYICRAGVAPFIQTTPTEGEGRGDGASTEGSGDDDGDGDGDGGSDVNTRVVSSWQGCCTEAYGEETPCQQHCLAGSTGLTNCPLEGAAWFANCIERLGAGAVNVGGSGAVGGGGGGPAAGEAETQWGGWADTLSPVAVLPLLVELGAAGARESLAGQTVVLECAAAGAVLGVVAEDPDPTQAGPVVSSAWLVLPSIVQNGSTVPDVGVVAAAASECPETSKSAVVFVVLGWLVLAGLIGAAYYNRESLWAGWNPTKYRQKGLNVRQLEVKAAESFQFVQSRGASDKANMQLGMKESSGDMPVRLGSVDETAFPVARPLHDVLSGVEAESEGYIDLKPESSDLWDGEHIMNSANSNPRLSMLSMDGARTAGLPAAPRRAKQVASPPPSADDGAAAVRALEAAVTANRRHSYGDFNSGAAASSLPSPRRATGRTSGGVAVVQNDRMSVAGPLGEGGGQATTFQVIPTRRSPNASPPSTALGQPRSSGLSSSKRNSMW
jgi:hypothetical protein